MLRKVEFGGGSEQKGLPERQRARCIVHWKM